MGNKIEGIVSSHTAYMREYRKNPKNKEYMKNYRKGNRKHINETDIEWRHTHPKPIRVSNSNYRLRNGKIKAAQAMALRHIPIEGLCELCPDDDKRVATERHHPDYDYPLIVIFSCKECHHYADEGE